MSRNVTAESPGSARTDAGEQWADDTPFGLSWEEEDGRNDPRQRFALYRLCECETCGGAGKLLLVMFEMPGRKGETHNRCPDCRGEGRTLQLLAACESPEAVGVTLVTLAREGEWAECPLGLLDRMPECGTCGGSGEDLNPLEGVMVPCFKCKGSGVKPSGTWLVLPWLPSARNVSDAGRTLRGARK